MPRKAKIIKRELLADPVYNSKVVSKLINKLMYGGKKQTSEKIIYGAFEETLLKLSKKKLVMNL